MAFKLKFDGIELSDFFTITDVDRDNQEEIVVEAKLIRKTTSTAQATRREIKKILVTKDYKELIFADEPNVLYYAKVEMNNIKSSNVNGWFHGLTITFTVKNGLAWSTSYSVLPDSKISYDTTKKQVNLSFDNNGTDTLLPIVTINHTSENGFLSLISPSQTLEMGDIEEIDNYGYKASEPLFDFRGFKTDSMFSTATKNVAITNSGLETQTGSLSVVNINSQKWLGLGTRGNTSSLDGAGATFAIPPDSEGNVGSINEELYWRFWFETGLASQQGVIKVSVTGENDVFLYGYEIFKRSRSNSSEVNFLIGQAGGGYRIVGQRTFTPSGYPENPFRNQEGNCAMYRNNDSVTFYYDGYNSVRDDFLKDKKSLKIHFFMAVPQGQEQVTRMYVANMFYQKHMVDKVADIPNRFKKDSVVVIDSENKTVTVDNLKYSELIWGSEFPKIQTGSSSAVIGFSSWISSLPTVSVKYRERWK